MVRKSSDQVYDYYDVVVPGDCYDNLEDAGSMAIDIARERTKIYAMPANWESRLITGKVGDYEITFRVRRVRFRRGKVEAPCTEE